MGVCRDWDAVCGDFADDPGGLAGFAGGWGIAHSVSGMGEFRNLAQRIDLVAEQGIAVT